jgi:hypothetical protein
MTRLVIVTVLLAVVAVFVFWRGRSAGPQRTVKVTARAGLARGSAVAVVEVDGRRFLLGAAGNTVNVLAELDAASVEENAPASAVEPAAIRAATPVVVQSVTPAVTPAVTVSQVPVAGTSSAALGGPLDRLKSLTVRTPVPARRALRSEL